MHHAPASTTSVGSGIEVAVVGGRQEYVRWAMSSDAAPPMNAVWGRPPGDGQAVYARVAGTLPRIRTDAIPVDQLRPQPEGTVAMLSVRKELDGRIQGFGSRFWSLLQDHCRRLQEQFEQGAPLTRVCYSDRYVATPWALLLLREVLLDLVREGRADSGTSLRLLTRDLRRDLRPGRDGRSISDQWQDEVAREAYFTQAFETGRSRLRWQGPLTFDTGPAPHFRELRLEWGNGVAWSLKLDQGVGYWRCRPSESFPFDGTPHEQVQVVNDIAKRCRVVSQSSHPTYIYVAAE